MGRTYNYFLFLAALVLYFLTTFSILCSNAANNNNNIHDLDALLAFKASLSDPNNILPTNWSTSISVCNWIGITCNVLHGRVAAIDLPNRGLIGTIPPQLGNLSFLVRVNVQNNSFHGDLPRELVNLRRLKSISLEENQFEGVFPSWLGALSQLEHLSLSHNRFSGSLMSSTIFNATKLETIDLAYNELTGNLPEEFSSLPKLHVLDLGFNQLRGHLPQALFNLSSLQKLSFANNSFSGFFPSRICHHLPQLQGLYLSFNEFQGEIPSSIKECSKIEVLDLSHNNLSGNIPEEFWNLTTLTRIYLGGNDLQGVIPRTMNGFYKLEIIELRSNRLRGSIPLKLFNISTLRMIDLSYNNFSGNVPSTLGIFLPNLENLHLEENNLSGLVLTSISNASKLMTLVLFSNQFTGVIPHSLGNLRFLEHLSLGVNNFYSDSVYEELSFFKSLTKCRNLKILWVSMNPLNGFLPISIGNLSRSLKFFAAGVCGITGEIPSSIGNLSELATLSLESNSLSGMIPTTLKCLTKLERTTLLDNKISGPIPNEFCDLLNLGWVDFGQNMLSKTVPSCIGNMTSLRYLYLHSNNLSSNLPASFWTLKDILEIDLSINSLTGLLPSEIDNFKALIKLNLSMNYFSGEMPSKIGTLQSLQELSLEHNNLQGLIPESMKNMFSLQYLDLSFNDLNGVIPNSLQTLSYLQYFNVSYNRLRGPIPRGGPFVNFTNLSFLCNEALCGAPWLQSCPTFEHRSKTKKVVLFTMLGTGYLMLVLVVLLLLLNKLTRKTVAPSEDLLPPTTFERVAFHEIQQITNGFDESNLLGFGIFGSVYKGIRANGMIWAIKVFDLQQEDAFKSFDKECEVLRCLRHRNLTKVISVCSNLDFKALVLEYMPNGSLEKWLYSDGHFLNFKQRLDIMIDVGCGLEYLHYGFSVPVVHSDLKPSNILLDQNMVGHVSDFGIAKFLKDEEHVRTNTLATFGYIAPEYGLEGLVSRSCDVYSFGIILMETFTKRKPNDEMFTEELSMRRWIQQSISDSVLHIIDASLLQPDQDHEVATKNIACISSILQLALSCTTNASKERMNIKDILAALQKIKIQFFQANITREQQLI